MNQAIGSLDKSLKTYMESIKKDHEKLYKAVKEGVVAPLNKFVTALEKLSAKGAEAIRKAEGRVQTMLELVNRTHKQLNSLLSGLKQDLMKATEEFKLGVPQNQTANVAKQIKTGISQLQSIKKAVEEVDQELIQMVLELKKDHSIVIEANNTDLGKAKGKIKTLNEDIKFCSGKLTELGNCLKKVVN